MIIHCSTCSFLRSQNSLDRLLPRKVQPEELCSMKSAGLLPWKGNDTFLSQGLSWSFGEWWRFLCYKFQFLRLHKDIRAAISIPWFCWKCFWKCHKTVGSIWSLAVTSLFPSSSASCLVQQRWTIQKELITAVWGWGFLIAPFKLYLLLPSNIVTIFLDIVEML